MKTLDTGFEVGLECRQVSLCLGLIFLCILNLSRDFVGGVQKWPQIQSGPKKGRRVTLLKNESKVPIRVWLDFWDYRKISLLPTVTGAVKALYRRLHQFSGWKSGGNAAAADKAAG